MSHDLEDRQIFVKYRMSSRLYDQKFNVLCSFSLSEFLLEGFSHEVFNEAIRAMQLAYAMYSFLQYRFSHWVFGWSF